MIRTWPLACLIVLALLPMGASADRHKRSTTHKPTKKVGQLRQDLAAVRAKKAKIRRELVKTKHEAKVVVADIQAVDQKIVTVQSALEDTTDRLDGSRREQSQLRVELASATKRLADTKVRVESRLREMYMEGKGTVVSALVGSRSIGDIASRKYLLEAIAEADRKLFDDYTTLRDTVAHQKERQDELVHRIARLADNQRTQKAELQDVRQEKKVVLGNLREKQGELQELLDQFESDERSITAQIQAYNARARSGGSRVVLPAFTGRFSRPINARMTSGFGMRYHPILHIRRLHAGVDFGAPVGTQIHAAADGVVIAAQYMRGYGNVVMIDHGGGISTVYGHCSRICCASGQRVARGQYIANVGSTGLSTGPHLHFEVRVNGHPVNPLGKL